MHNCICLLLAGEEMGKRIDLTGKRVGKLTVIDYAYTKNSKAYWNCICDCGNKCIVTARNLITAMAKSCGCNKRESMRTVALKHGGSGTRLYSIWCNMKDRCNNPNNNHYHRYGGRGITICPEWVSDFSSFESWALAHGYNDELSIDRINNDAGYRPENCRWVTNKVQQNNKSTNHLITYRGKTMNVIEWAEETEIPADTLYDRLGYGWTLDEVFNKPIKRCNVEYYTYEGASHTLSEWAQIKDIKYDVLYHRVVDQHISFEEALTKPVGRGKVELNGRWDTIANFAKEYDISVETVRYRMKQQGMTLEQALTTPVNTSYSRKKGN